MFIIQGCHEASREMFNTSFSSVCFPKDNNGKFLFADTLIICTNDTATFSFSIQPPEQTDYDINIPIKVTGLPTDYDRTFSLAVDAKNTTAVEGVNYQALKSSYIMPSNEVSTYIPIKIFRTSDIANAPKDLQLYITSSSDFSSPVIAEQSVIHLRFNDILTEPKWWKKWIAVLGRWSRAKYQRWLVIWGTTNLTMEGPGAPIPSLHPKEALAAEKLREYFTNHPTYDENNQLITVPYYY